MMRVMTIIIVIKVGDYSDVGDDHNHDGGDDDNNESDGGDNADDQNYMIMLKIRRWIMIIVINESHNYDNNSLG